MPCTTFVGSPPPKSPSSQSAFLRTAESGSSVTHNTRNLPGLGHFGERQTHVQKASLLWLPFSLPGLLGPPEPRVVSRLFIFPNSSLFFTQPPVELTMLIGAVDFLFHL